jgi:peptide/nickel transport system ATP-binding protein
VRNVSLDVQPGEILGIVGESGSGKTVLGLSLLGLVGDRSPAVIQGRVEVAGIDMVSASAEQRRLVRRDQIGAVFQDPMTSLNPTMRIGRQLREVTGSREQAIAVLESVGVPQPEARYQSYPHQLSGGLRQRVMIAMAIARRPGLVLADEPTTALDVTVQAQILALIRRLREDDGTAFVFITHDLGVTAQVADRIAVMYGGRLIEVGETRDVLGRPGHPYTWALLKSRLRLDSRREEQLATLEGEPPDPRHNLPGCPLAPRCPLRIEACVLEVPPLAETPQHAGVVACIRSAEVADLTSKVEAPVWPLAAQPPGRFALELSGVTVSYPVRVGRERRRLHALRGVDLEVRPGESVAIVGESGCGKSTLLRVVAGLVKPSEGQVALADGHEPQIIFQDAGASLTPWLTVGELIGERLLGLGGSRAEVRRRVAETLELVGLPAETAHAKPGQLSGGQRQRAAIARAIVVPPPVLLCDEPTSALDVSLAATILNLLGRLRRELGMALLFVTHDVAAARIVADRVVVMYLGRIVEAADAASVGRDLVHPYARALLSAVPEAGRTVEPLSGDPASPISPPSGCAFHPRCPDALDACAGEDPVLLPVRGARQVACLRHQVT